jgi:hypothetical protein
VAKFFTNATLHNPITGWVCPPEAVDRLRPFCLHSLPEPWDSIACIGVPSRSGLRGRRAITVLGWSRPPQGHLHSSQTVGATCRSSEICGQPCVSPELRARAECQRTV